MTRMAKERRRRRRRKENRELVRVGGGRE